jgi:hypothetical protein
LSQDDREKLARIAEAWGKRFETWTPSGRAISVTDVNVINDLIGVLAFWYQNEKKVGYFGEGVTPLKVINELQEDKIGTGLELIGKVCEQIREHRKLWETSGRNTSLKAFETGFWIYEKDLWKYFKFQITADGNNWRVPAKIKAINIHYHKESKNGECQIEIKTYENKSKKN